MMFKCITLLILSSCTCLGQPEQATGARSAALGGASVCLSDNWSINNNPAGLAILKTTSISTWYQDPYAVKAIQLTALALAVPTPKGTFGVLVSGYGYEEYQENTTNITYARAFGKHISAGISLNYLYTHIAQGYGTGNSMGGSLGMLVRIQPGLYVGASLYNPTRAKIDSRNQERIPASLRIGLMYLLNTNVRFCLETEKTTSTEPVFKAGIEYQPHELITFRAGTSTTPNSCSMGVGFVYHAFRFDFSDAWQPAIGFLPGVGLGYTFPPGNHATH
ncbi:MAG TPA: hypothetical protein VNZ86_09825 [Bacteroidia bacterium]|jgi:hypothetical protein|nr:hypothetical protein [Bacteroidia bacterium]